MVTSPYEWKILEWDEKHKTNKQDSKPQEGSDYLQPCVADTQNGQYTGRG